MLNKIFLQGRFVADPDLRHTPSGVAVATFRLAVDRDFKSKETGETQTDFIHVVAWRQTGEFVSKFFSKGRMAIIEGRLQIRDYTDKEGTKRTTAEVVADNVYFGDSKSNSSVSGSGYDTTSHAAKQSTVPAPYAAPTASFGDQFAELDDDDGELPF